MGKIIRGDYVALLMPTSIVNIMMCQKYLTIFVFISFLKWNLLVCFTIRMITFIITPDKYP